MLHIFFSPSNRHYSLLLKIYFVGLIARQKLSEKAADICRCFPLLLYLEYKMNNVNELDCRWTDRHSSCPKQHGMNGAYILPIIRTSYFVLRLVWSKHLKRIRLEGLSWCSILAWIGCHLKQFNQKRVNGFMLILDKKPADEWGRYVSGGMLWVWEAYV